MRVAKHEGWKTWGLQSMRVERHEGCKAWGLESMRFAKWSGLIWGGHCDWPIAKWGCLIGGDRLQILINWGVLGRIQKTSPVAKRGCLIGGDILILYKLYWSFITTIHLAASDNLSWGGWLQHLLAICSPVWHLELPERCLTASQPNLTVSDMHWKVMFHGPNAGRLLEAWSQPSGGHRTVTVSWWPSSKIPQHWFVTLDLHSVC